MDLEHLKKVKGYCATLSVITPLHTVQVHGKDVAVIDTNSIKEVFTAAYEILAELEKRLTSSQLSFNF